MLCTLLTPDYTSKNPRLGDADQLTHSMWINQRTSASPFRPLKSFIESKTPKNSRILAVELVLNTLLIHVLVKMSFGSHT